MSSLLDSWFLAKKREFPWRENITPYRVWVSEVMLQQTRAQVVVAYFERWMELFPDVETLAGAKLEEVIKAWEGLGYYRRARYLHAGAQQVVREHGGKIPSEKEELLKIQGLGPYTVAAILSFGFRQRAAAVDGNVSRVIARYGWIDEDIGKSSGKKKVREFTEQFLSHDAPWVTMEALIELGAVVCGRVPQCGECPLQAGCKAHARGGEQTLPIKAEAAKIEKIVRAVAVIESDGMVLVRKNEPGQLMGDLYEFPYFEGVRSLLGIRSALVSWFEKLEFIESMGSVEHSFTRFSAKLFPFYFRADQRPQIEQYSWISKEVLTQLPFSSGHRKILMGQPWIDVSLSASNSPANSG